MSRERLLVIGGNAAGMSAASRARRVNREMEIIVLEKGEHISYGTCGLPYFLSGQVSDWHQLVVHSTSFFREQRSIDVRTGQEVLEIDPGRRLVHVREHGSRLWSCHYDKLVLATGGEPAVRIDGEQTEGVFSCNDLPGAIRLRNFIVDKSPRRAVVVGSGYIGLEVADALVSRGLQVTVLERCDELMDGIEPEIEARLVECLSKHSVSVRKRSPVTQIVGSPGRLSVLSSAGESTEADIVVLATGIVPRVSLAESCGIALGPSGAIAVDNRMQTNLSGIFAAGDCAEVQNLVSGTPCYVPLGTTANKQGRVAGENAAGGRATFDGVVGTLVTRVFELEVARTGLGVTQARKSGFTPDKVAVRTYSRAQYLQGSPIDTVLIFDLSSGRLLGCQMIGEEGVAKRIDAVAVALHARMRIPDLLHLDLSYAPPFGPVWEGLLVAARQAVKKLS
jgi:NADPH-dependent 2,4-dienoyl-CoA reductase/sulfur reductase-like enzyme